MLNASFPVTMTVSVALSRIPATCEGVNVTLIVQPGAPIILEPCGLVPHVSVSVKSCDPIDTLLTEVAESMKLTVAVPVPPMLTTTDSGALGTPVVTPGTPNDKFPGETVTVVPWACTLVAVQQHTAATNATKRTFIFHAFIAASLRRIQMYR
jgi:hypothetical protein